MRRDLLIDHERKSQRRFHRVGLPGTGARESSGFKS